MNANRNGREWCSWVRGLGLAAIVLLGLSLAGCGGGGGSSSSGGATTYSISGSVTGAASVTVTLSGNATAATTDANGNFSFASVANGSYTLTPSKSGYTFSPSSVSVTVNGANVSSGTSFTATANPTYALSGTVSGAISGGVTLALSGAASGSTVSASGGSYSFASLAPGSYTVTPALSGYTFSPASVTVTIGSGDSTGNDFTSTAVVSSFAISGTVSGAVAAGVTVTATGAATQAATTATDGTYTLASMPNGAYTLTPSLAGYTFNPVSHSVTVAGANVTGENFVSSANVAPTFTLSGTVSGPWVDKVSVTLSGAGAGTTLTDASGAYSFSNLLAGSYTVTPALPGYSYAPAAPSVSVNANATQNFSATSRGTSDTVSGTISYAGAKTGKVFVYARQSCCLTQSPVAGTAVDLVSGSASYAIRGLQPGNSYVITAEMDTLANGRPNVVNPTSTSGTLTLAAATTTQNFTLTDPAPVAPVAPSALGVYAESGAIMALATPALNSNGQELATSYTLQWGTDVNASTGGGTQTVPARGANSNVIFVRGLASGTLYFKMTATIGSTTSAPTAVVGPVTIAATSGANTVTGTVTFPVTATGPMLVGLYSQTLGVYFAPIQSPVSPQSYSIAGVPNGTYTNFAVIDQNNDGAIGPGDLTNTNGKAPLLVVSGNTTGNLTLSNADVTEAISTNFGTNGTTSNYGSNVRVSDGIKRVVSAVLYSAPTANVPFDLPATQGGDVYVGGSGGTPTSADVYTFRVKYSDGTTADVTASPGSPILGPAAVATNLVVNTASPYSRTVPQFQWSAPATPPAGYEYFIYVDPVSGGQVWSYPNNGSGLPSTQLNVVFNVDGAANPASLVTGTPYNWAITVRDPATGNSAQMQAPSYTP